MQFSKHALDRMGERQISRPTVLAVIKSGVKTVAEGGRCAYSSYGYVVVTCAQTETVVTVFNEEEFSPNWNRKKAITKRRQLFRKQLRQNKQYSGGNW